MDRPTGQRLHATPASDRLRQGTQATKNPLDASAAMVTTKTLHEWKTVDGVTLEFVSSILHG